MYAPLKYIGPSQEPVHINIIRGVKIHRYAGVYLDTDHKICISYHAKLILLYLDIHLPLQTQTVGDLQGQFVRYQTFLVHHVHNVPAKMFTPKARTYLV